MIYYIDGYNLLFSFFTDCEKNDPLESEAIHQFIYRVTEVGLRVVLVFDAYNSPAQLSRFDFRDIEVVFTALDQKADDYFIELAQFGKNKEKTTFVSNDKSLSQSLRQREAKTLTISQFVKLVNQRAKKKSLRGTRDEKYGDPSDNDYYYKVFKKKSEEE